jgi:hypothetical protein
MSGYIGLQKFSTQFKQVDAHRVPWAFEEHAQIVVGRLLPWPSLYHSRVPTIRTGDQGEPCLLTKGTRHHIPHWPWLQMPLNLPPTMDGYTSSPRLTSWASPLGHGVIFAGVAKMLHVGRCVPPPWSTLAKRPPAWRDLPPALHQAARCARPAPRRQPRSAHPGQTPPAGHRRVGVGDFGEQMNWSTTQGVMVLDPYGMKGIFPLRVTIFAKTFSDAPLLSH